MRVVWDMREYECGNGQTGIEEGVTLGKMKPTKRRGLSGLKTTRRRRRRCFAEGGE